MKRDKIIKRKYYLTQKELKEKFGIKGSIVSIELWAGIASIDEGKNKEDECEWKVETLEGEDLEGE